MRVVLASKVPAVFTAYIEFEVRNDTNLLLDLGASFMKTWELNISSTTRFYARNIFLHLEVRNSRPQFFSKHVKLG
jgi:hypothetical protein